MADAIRCEQADESDYQGITALTVEESIIRDKAILKVTPVHHAQGAASEHGDVIVRIVISEQGEVMQAICIKGSPPIRQLVEVAAKRWMFQPFLINGKPSRVESTLTFRLAN